MPSTADADAVRTPPGAVRVARRYRRVERPVSAAMALLLGAVVAAALLRLRLVPALVVAIVVLAAVRVPVFRSVGSAELSTDADPRAVREAFVGPTPPPLALQWGIADARRSTDDGGVYEIRYLFGLRSVAMTVECRSPADGDSADVELVVTVDGRPWGTYAVSIHDRTGSTAVDVDWASDRRFGLRRLPQWLIAERYREAALAAQGYAVVDRDATIRL